MYVPQSIHHILDQLLFFEKYKMMQKVDPSDSQKQKTFFRETFSTIN